MKASIKQNIYGNWYGYLGGRKVESFFGSGGSGGGQEFEARQWLRSAITQQDIIERKQQAAKAKALPKQLPAVVALEEIERSARCEDRRGITRKLAPRVMLNVREAAFYQKPRGGNMRAHHREAEAQASKRTLRRLLKLAEAAGFERTARELRVELEERK